MGRVSRARRPAQAIREAFPEEAELSPWKRKKTWKGKWARPAYSKLWGQHSGSLPPPSLPHFSLSSSFSPSFLSSLLPPSSLLPSLTPSSLPFHPPPSSLLSHLLPSLLPLSFPTLPPFLSFLPPCLPYPPLLPSFSPSLLPFLSPSCPLPFPSSLLSLPPREAQRVVSGLHGPALTLQLEARRRHRRHFRRASWGTDTGIPSTPASQQTQTWQGEVGCMVCPPAYSGSPFPGCTRSSLIPLPLPRFPRGLQHICLHPTAGNCTGSG